MVLKGTVFMKRYNKVMVCMSFLLVSALVGCSQKDIENTSNVTSAIISNGTHQSNQLTKMEDYPQVGNGEANQVAYSLFCLKEVVFENGSVWSNPEYDDFFQTYAGKQIDVDTLQNYYPYTYDLKTDQDL